MNNTVEDDKMTANAALAELESTADVGEAKRDLVLRFVRDQESLQTSQVELKLVGDDTIDLIDSAFTANEIALQKNNEQTNSNGKSNEDLLRTGVSGITLDDDHHYEAKGRPPSGLAQMPRPLSGRPQSRRAHRKTSSEFKDKRKTSYTSKINDLERFSNNCPMSPLPMDAYDGLHQPIQYVGQPEDFDSNSGLNSSWPQQVLTRKTSTGSSGRKHAFYTPEKPCFLEHVENVYPQNFRPTSSQSFQCIASGEAVIAARVRKHSANERITSINQMIDSPIHHSRSSSPAKSTRRLTSRGRTLINLGLEPVDPSEIPMLRAASAGKTASLSCPYTLVQLPPISRETPTATPPFS